jgi:hypothetical protein
VKNYLIAPDGFHMQLPRRTEGRRVIFVPYFRFKGTVFTCDEAKITYRIIDVTSPGVSVPGLPPSLGLRPQAMKLRFLTAAAHGRIARCTITGNDMQHMIERITSSSRSGTRFHRVFIGEVLSRIYLPLYLHHGKVFDAVTDTPLPCRVREEELLNSKGSETDRRYTISFLPTLCPLCGWNLEGERDSVVLACRHCSTFWEVRRNTFSPVQYASVRGNGAPVVFLPFWKTTAKVEGFDIRSYADFIRITNQPKVITKEWEDREMEYWSPAFKVRPRIFLRLSRRLTISQTAFTLEDSFPGNHLYPVTMPGKEASQSLKLILAVCALTKEALYPELPRMEITAHASTLVYLPFLERGQELVQPHLRMSIYRQTLAYGHYL